MRVEELELHNCHTDGLTCLLVNILLTLTTLGLASSSAAVVFALEDALFLQSQAG
jgi:hypothetical protein